MGRTTVEDTKMLVENDWVRAVALVGMVDDARPLPSSWGREPDEQDGQESHIQAFLSPTSPGHAGPLNKRWPLPSAPLPLPFRDLGVSSYSDQDQSLQMQRTGRRLPATS